MSRARLAVIALCALIVIVGGWALTTRTTNPTITPPSAATATAADGTCPLASLPPEAAETVRLIHTDGPFPFPRSDGAVFGNREGHLPKQTKGYYREYTVITPGAGNRATRRIITGGSPATDPRQYYYTNDHYDSFCVVPDAGGRP